MVLTGRAMDAQEALHHGVVSRVVPREQLDEEVFEMATKIAAAPEPTIRVARRILGHLATPAVLASMDEEMVAQTFLKHERNS
jgi:enoyl-CoA hydratase/carnithine racemase